MDESDAPLVRADGSGLSIAVTLGSHTRVYLDDGDPPMLVIDSGQAQVTIEPYAVQRSVLSPVKDLVEAAQRLLASTKAQIDAGATEASRDPDPH